MTCARAITDDGIVSQMRTVVSPDAKSSRGPSGLTRYSLIGAAAIRAELKAPGIRPLPCERTIERVLRRNGLTLPRVRLAPLPPRQDDPGRRLGPPTTSMRSTWSD